MMPQPMPCDVCNQTTADFVVTEVASGDVIGVGIECLEDYTAPIIEAYKEYQAREVAEMEAEAEAEILSPPESEPERVTAAPKRRQKAAAAAVEGQEQSPKTRPPANDGE